MPARFHIPIVNHHPVPNYRMIVIREGCHWVAMLADHWLVAQGKSRQEAVDALRGLTVASWRFNWLRSYKRAPDDYQARYASRRLWTGSDACKKRPELFRIGTRKKAAP